MYYYLTFFLLFNDPFLSLGNNQSSENEQSNEDKKVPTKNISIMQILAIPTIWFSFVTFVVATVCNGFLSINLEPKVSRNMKAVFYTIFFCEIGVTKKIGQEMLIEFELFSQVK